MPLSTRTLNTPLGPFTVVSGDGGVRIAGFMPIEELVARCHPETLLPAPLPAISASLNAYFDGDLHALDSIPVEQSGTPFLAAAWRALRSVAAGTSVSYTELAELAGSPRAVRAAASACARNAVCLIVPCHRVVRSGGELGNYHYGRSRKRWLLDHEGCNSVARDRSRAHPLIPAEAGTGRR